MLKLKALSCFVCAASVLVFAFGAISEATLAEPLEYRFVLDASTSSGRHASLNVPVRAPFAGLRTSVRICIDGSRSAFEAIELLSAGIPAQVSFMPESEGCAVTQELELPHAGGDGLGGVVGITARTLEGDTVTFQMPVAEVAPYLASESFFTLPEATLGTVAATFPAKPVTNRTKSVVLCTAGRRKLTEAKLWMPSMGHGSTATTLSERPDGCYLVDRLNFVMTGAWELRTTWMDGAAATFAFDVVRAVP